MGFLVLPCVVSESDTRPEVCLQVIDILDIPGPNIPDMVRPVVGVSALNDRVDAAVEKLLKNVAYREFPRGSTWVQNHRKEACILEK
jgi:hypothetical protein